MEKRAQNQNGSAVMAVHEESIASLNAVQCLVHEGCHTGIQLSPRFPPRTPKHSPMDSHLNVLCLDCLTAS